MELNSYNNNNNLIHSGDLMNVMHGYEHGDLILNEKT